MEHHEDQQSSLLPQSTVEGIPRLLTGKDLETATGIPEATWRWWRAQGKGPRAIKFGRNRTYYDPADVRQWLDAHRESEVA